MSIKDPMPDIDNDPTPEEPTPDPVQVPPAPYEESPSSTGSPPRCKGSTFDRY